MKTHQERRAELQAMVAIERARVRAKFSGLAEALDRQQYAREQSRRKSKR
jgi:hypothetical protein